MKSFSRRRGFRVALVASAALIAVLAFYPLDATPVTGHDKLNHLIAFAMLAWLADGAYPDRRPETIKWCLVFAYGLFVEIVQHHLPYRDFSWLDLSADLMGILAYLAARSITTTAARVPNRPLYPTGRQETPTPCDASRGKTRVSIKSASADSAGYDDATSRT